MARLDDCRYRFFLPQVMFIPVHSTTFCGKNWRSEKASFKTPRVASLCTGLYTNVHVFLKRGLLRGVKESRERSLSGFLFGRPKIFGHFYVNSTTAERSKFRRGRNQRENVYFTVVDCCRKE